MRKALVVGINNYPSAPLHCCINDARAVADVLERHENGSPNFSVKIAEDVKTKAELKGLVVDLFSGDPDIALLYFSGHGSIDSLGGYIVTPDYAKHDPGISMDDILILANKSRATNKIIIFDCCYSGAMGLPQITGGKEAHLSKGLTILTASTESEFAMEVNGHGVFTNLLLLALEGGASDLTGSITLGGVYAYIDQALGPWKQRPVFKTNISKFVSLRNIQPRVSTDLLRKINSLFPTPDYEFPLDKSYEDTNVAEALSENVMIFKQLQELTGVALVVPVKEKHMYYEAQNAGSCKLTLLGQHYWRLANDKLI